jgi:hypothetical protein
MQYRPSQSHFGGSGVTHARWAARADRRQAQADKARAEAEALLANRNRDWAFVSQPGHIPARARELTRTDRAMILLAATDLAESKARNLRAMAERRAGDAERERQAARDAVAWSVGQAVVSILYGPATVLKVNAKTIRIRLDRTGGTITEDKARCK